MKPVQLAFIALLPLLVAPAAWALINPNFTPIHVVEQSDLLLVVKGKAKDVADKFELETVKAHKGKAPAAMAIDVTAAPKQHVEAIRQALNGHADQPMLLFVGKYEKDETGFLHAGGAWWRLSGGGGEGQWKLVGKDGDMQATWAGGTDMFIRCVAYILAEGVDAAVPVKSGTGWRGEPKLVATLKAAKPTARNISAVDLAGDGKLSLYVALPEGDRLFKAVSGKEEFEDITDKTGLKAKSLAGCWGDFNDDGRLDLLSFDGKTLWLWNQNADGTFASVKAGGSFSIPAECPGLETIWLAGANVPAVVVSGAMPPAILKPSGKDAFASVSLPEPKTAPAWGKAQAALAADFNNDNLPDVLVPYERNGLFYAAKKGGGFEEPKTCGVNCTSGGGVAVAGDFDGDGWLDVLVAGAEGPRIFQNLHDGTFDESLAASGEVAYKGQPFASWCGVCDFNNDGRLDLFLTYANQAGLLYFNRGFRSFGQAPDLEIKLGEGIEGFDKGQQLGVFADFDGDGAQDYAILLPDGKLYVACNDFGEDARCVKVRLPKGSPGPVNVSLWAGKRLLGTRPVRFGQPVFWGIPSAGKYTLKWQYPGGAEQSKAISVEKPLDVVLEGAIK